MTAKFAIAEKAAVLPTSGPFVYVMQAVTGEVKIGTTQNLQQRFLNLQNSCPVELDCLAWCAGGLLEERLFHVTFEKFRLHGEWFSPAPELLEFTARLSTALLRSIPAALAAGVAP